MLCPNIAFRIAVESSSSGAHLDLPYHKTATHIPHSLHPAYRPTAQSALAKLDNCPHSQPVTEATGEEKYIDNDRYVTDIQSYTPARWRDHANSTVDVAADGEVRRSGRATKGKHTGRIDIEPHTPVPRKKKEQVPRELVSGDGEGGADEVIRCVCGADTEDEDDSRMMVQCEKCLVWQHNICLGITKNKIPDNYFCELCRPDMHEDFLRRVAAGEKPWERGKGRRKSRKSFGNPRSRKGGSEAASEAPPSVDAGTPRPRDTSHAGPMDIDGRSPAPALISDGYVRPERTNGQTGDKMDVEETGKQRSRESTVDANPEMAARHSRDSTEEMLPPTVC